MATNLWCQHRAARTSIPSSEHHHFTMHILLLCLDAHVCGCLSCCTLPTSCAHGTNLTTLTTTTSTTILNLDLKVHQAIPLVCRTPTHGQGNHTAKVQVRRAFACGDKILSGGCRRRGRRPPFFDCTVNVCNTTRACRGVRILYLMRLFVSLLSLNRMPVASISNCASSCPTAQSTMCACVCTWASRI